MRSIGVNGFCRDVGMSACRFAILLHNTPAWMILSEYQEATMGCRYHYVCFNVVMSDISFVCVIFIVNFLFFIPACRYVACRIYAKYYRFILLKLLLLNPTHGLTKMPTFRQSVGRIRYLGRGFPSQRPVTRSSDVFFDLRWTNGWANNRDAGDLRRHGVNHEVIVMLLERSCHMDVPVNSDVMNMHWSTSHEKIRVTIYTKQNITS